MKRFLIILALLMILASPAWAQTNRRMGPVNTPADPTRQTLFNKTTDFFATAGMPTQDKQEVLRQRQEWRRQERISKQRRKNNERTQRRIKKEQKAIMDKL